MTGAVAMALAVFAAAISFNALAAVAPAGAQELSKGDYELCSVYDKNDDFVGYDSACLARQRAEVSRYNRYSRRAGASEANAYGPYYCPSWANQGNEYSVYMSGPYGPAAATADSPVNGRPCLPHPNYTSYGWY